MTHEDFVVAMLNAVVVPGAHQYSDLVEQIAAAVPAPAGRDTRRFLVGEALDTLIRRKVVRREGRTVIT